MLSLAAMELTRTCVFLVLGLAFIVECYTGLETNTVATKQGDIVGYNKELIINNEVRTVQRYLGIPYARPPVGDLRFKKSEEPEPFVELFKAFEFGAVCPQVELPFLPFNEESSEDCLFLNIFVPTSNHDQLNGYPVMVFVHGGGFDYGTGNTYIADNLASYGNVIVVTINYRLGVFGFLSTNDTDAPGNAGLWDQHLAFKWVNKNIGAFGGDNDRVAIFGESAGAVSVLMQALYPGNKGLFQRVIAESGSALMWLSIKEDHNDANKKLAQHFNCDVGDVVSCLNRLNSSEIIETMYDTIKDMEDMLSFTFRPTVDADFLKIAPIQMAENEDKYADEVDFFRSLDLINGVNSDEASNSGIFIAGINDSESFQPSREMMNTQLVRSAFMFYPKETPTDFVTKLTLSEYTDWSSPDDPKTIRAEFSRLISDMTFNVGAVEQSRMHCSSEKTGRNFFYIFNTDSDTSAFPKPSWANGAVHGEELGFVFGFNEEMIDIYKKKNTSGLKDNIGLGICERRLSEQMMRYWSNFAAHGDPNGPQANGDKEWPQYDLATQKAFVISEKYSGEDAIRYFPYARAANFWTNIIPATFNASRSSDAKDSEAGDSFCSTEGDCDNV